jgi:hypothetical protein
MCIAIPAGFGGVGDCGQISDGKSKVEYLYLRFDASGKVRDIRTPAVHGAECIEPGVCPGSLLLVRDDVTRTIPAGFYANLERRDGLYYERDSEVPFTGRRELRHPDGSPAGHLEFENGLENGYHCEWYETGQVKLLAHYEKGHKQGVERGWHENGTMSYRVSYASGLIDGQATAWKPDGTVVMEACFRNDVLVGVSSEECAN